MPSSTPLVSVVITAYRHEKYIANTIKSVLAQTHRPLQVIVVDDGSPDRTGEIAASFGDQVQLISQANTGVAGARNRGVSAAQGELVAFLDGDDEWESTKIERQVDAYRAHPEAGLIVAGLLQFDGDQTLMAESYQRFPTAERIVVADVYHELLESNFIPTTSQVMVPLRVLAEIGRSDSTFKVASDYDLYLRIASRYPVAFVRQLLTRWRYLPTSVSGPSDRRRFTWGADIAAVLHKHQRSVDRLTRRQIQHVLRKKLWQLGMDACYTGVDGNRIWASRLLAKLALSCPRFPWVWLFVAGLWTPKAIRAAASRRLTERWRAA